jgi:glycosyltransferase involved in cell wall biosynthesis
MHIAYVCPRYPPGSCANGISTYTALMAREMAARGHRVTMLCLDGVAAGSDDVPYRDGPVAAYSAKPRLVTTPVLRVIYYRFGYRLFPGRFQSRELGLGLREAVRKVLGQDRFDLLECPEGRGVSRWIKDLGFPVVVRLHAPFAVTAAANGVRPDREYRATVDTERRGLAEARFVSAPTHAVVRETERLLDLKIENAQVIANPAELRIPDPSGQDRIADGHRGILFVGRVSLLKGFDVLIRAFTCLAAEPEYRDLRLTVVGPENGLLLDGKRTISGTEFIGQTARDPKVASRIQLLGPLPYEQVQQLRSRGTITVVPSVFENFSSTVIEAMASRCPVVASRTGGTPEIIQHERNGLLFEKGDPGDLAKQLRRLLSDEELGQRLADQACQDVAERYGPTTIAEQMEQYYEQIISQATNRKKNPTPPGLPDAAGRDSSGAST